MSKYIRKGEMYMENRYFTKPSLVDVACKIESTHVFDASDPKWAHPDLSDKWSFGSGAAIQMTDPRVPLEDRAKLGTMVAQKSLAAFAKNKTDELCDCQKFTVPGCPEEPDTEVEVRVYRPKGMKKKKARCFFYCLGGGLCMREPEMFPIGDACVLHNAVAVVVMYRRAWEAEYPAAINDLHAAYQWMLDNAEMLQINPDNIVITGMSSGGHLAVSFPFRLMRYGLPTPKGVVAIVPTTDDRDKDGIGYRIHVDGHNAATQRQMTALWMGHNFANSQIGPESYANHATVEDCVGYPPTFIHTVEFDPSRDSCREFYGKLLEAKTYAEFHCWAGAHHGSGAFDGSYMNGDESDYSKVVNIVVNKNITDCFTHDLRRPWVTEK